MASSFQNKVKKEYENKGYTVLKVMKMSANGYPDLLCMKLGETDTWIECKESNDTLKPLQKLRIDELRNLGKNAFCLKDGMGKIY